MQKGIGRFLPAFFLALSLVEAVFLASVMRKVREGAGGWTRYGLNCSGIRPESGFFKRVFMDLSESFAGVLFRLRREGTGVFRPVSARRFPKPGEGRATRFAGTEPCR